MASPRRSDLSLRTSDYVIYCPLPGEERWLLVHGYTGAVDVVSSTVADFLRARKRPGAGAAPTLPREVRERLRSRGYLTWRTPAEEEEHFCRLGRALHDRQRGARSTFYLMPTYRCQLRCPYCFELPQYRKGSDFIDRTVDREMVDGAFRAIRAIRAIQPDPAKVGEITLYGGEPLQADQVGIMTYIVAKGTELGYRFWCISNGVDLDHYLHLLGPGKIEVVQVTVDGPPRIHDQRRRGPKREGTFWRIVRNVSRALETGVQISLRTNVDGRNAEALSELARFYADQGWTQKPNFRSYCQVVYQRSYDRRGGEEVVQLGKGAKRGAGSAVDPTGQISYSRVHLAELLGRKRREEPDLRFMIGGFGIHRKIVSLLDRGPLQAFQPTFCGSHNGMFVFDPHGSIYACTESVGEEMSKIGAYWPDLRLDRDRLSAWRERTVMSIPACRRCPYALFCGGGCAQHAYWAYGSIMDPFCAEYQELFVRLAPDAYAKWLEKRSERAIEQAGTLPA